MAADRSQPLLSLDDLRTIAEQWLNPPHEQAHSARDLSRLAHAVIRLLEDDARHRPIFDLVVELVDADQCEDHCTGDDCDQGEVEHRLFQKLAEIQTNDGRTDPIVRGEKKHLTAAPSKLDHVPSSVDGCVSWCPACIENTSRMLNADGSVKERSDG